MGVVEREETMDEGKEARKALSILIVRGTYQRTVSLIPKTRRRVAYSVKAYTF